MKNKLYILFFLLFLFEGCNSIQKKDENLTRISNTNNFKIIIGQEFINEYLQKLGSVSGEEKVSGKKFMNLVKFEENLKWKIYNIKVKVTENGTEINGDAHIIIGENNIDTSFKAKGEIKYDNEKELLIIEPKDMRLKQFSFVNISNFYGPNIEIKISNPFNKSIKIKTEDGTYKNIEIKTNIEIMQKNEAIEIVMQNI